MKKTSKSNFGFVLVDKEIGLSSFYQLKRYKEKFATTKIGHCGTLDPFASGLLILAVGKYTKLLPLLNNLTKTYIGKIKLGEQTDTFDSTGKITNKESEIAQKMTITKVEDVIKRDFLGEITQVPPVFSAKKINGKRAYEHARKGQDIVLEPKKINISFFKVKLIDNNILEFKITVSSGTYIRSIANDLGIKLGTYGHLIELRRISIGKIKLDKNTKLDTLIDAQSILIENEFVNVNDSEANDIRNGRDIAIKNFKENLLIATYHEEIIAILNHKGEGIFSVTRGI